jgi:hypothetical protein
MTLIERLFNKFLGYLLPAAKLLARSGGQALIAAAQEAVLAAEKTNGSGEDKLNAARKAVVKSLQRQGLPVITNAINLAIETAVASMNSK